MNTLKFVACSVALLFSIQFSAVAQSDHISETFKTHFNETVQQVQKTDNADIKRDLLNDSFDKMLTALNRIESATELSEAELAQVHSFKDEIQERKNELNGLGGFDEVVDEDLDDFSNFSQQAMEQASRTITLSLTTALLIVIILLLL